MANRLTPDQMVTIKAIAPFEVVEALNLWAEQYRVFWEAARGPHDVSSQSAAEALMASLEDEAIPNCCGGLGPPFRQNREEISDWSLRCATAIFTLLKEI